MFLQKDFGPILNLKTAYSSRKFHYLDETASLVAPHSPSFMPNYSGTMIPPLPALQFSSTNAQYEFLKIYSPFFIAKGQSISKRFLGSPISSKNKRKQVDLSYHSSKPDSSVCFLEEFDDPKKPF